MGATAASGSIRVGVIGVNPNRGWAWAAHLPALASLDGIETVAVASTRAEGAAQVARQFNVPLSFGDPHELVAHPDVDVVAITVKTPDHDKLVRAALEAGKHVFCEWPLAVSAEQARPLAQLAADAGVQNMIGLQAMHAPGALFVREIIDRGDIGKVAGVSMASLTPGLYGPEIASSMSYTLDPRNGTNILTTPSGHALAAISAAVGDLTEVSATARILYPTVTLRDTGERVSNVLPNELALSGPLAGGGLASLAVHGGTPLGAPRLSMRVNGTDGALVVGVSRAEDSVNVGDWTVAFASGDGTFTLLDVPEDPRLPAGTPSGPVKNVALMYLELVDAILNNRPVRPDFALATRFHETLEAIAVAASSGVRQTLNPYS